MTKSCKLNSPAQPCPSCPWITSNTAADIPNFDLALAEKLAACSPDERDVGPNYDAAMFACHQSREGAEIACAGWLAAVGNRHPRVRLAVTMDRLDPAALQAGPGWPALHASYGDVLVKLRATAPSGQAVMAGADVCTWDGIAKIVEESRAIHEVMLHVSEIDATAGSCLYASFNLRMSLEKFAGCIAVVRGGDGQADGGAMDSEGRWRGHYWVEGVTPEGTAFVADVTADQFGHAAVYFERAELARARYLPGHDEAVTAAVVELEQGIAVSFHLEEAGQ